MTHNYNSTQLVKFLYGEGFITDILEVEYALKNDQQLAAEYHTLLQAKAMLPKVTFSPSSITIDRLLEKSREIMPMA